MGKRLWLDDCRKMPADYDLWAKTADEAIEMLQKHEIDHCSLDHDLADDHYKYGLSGHGEPPIPRESFKEKTGYSVLLWMAENRQVAAERLRTHRQSKRQRRYVASTGTTCAQTTKYKYVPSWQVYGEPENG